MEKIVRPWGFYSVLFLEAHFQIKLLSVNPGESLSLQYHHHRTEHWVVTGGVGLIEIDGLYELARAGVTLTIKPRQVHRATVSPEHTEPLTICEVQCGDILSEEDIVRLEDQYGRV